MVSMKVSRNVAGRPTCLAIATIATMCACAPLPQAQAASLEWVHTETNGPFAPRISAAAAVIDRGQAALLMGGSGHYPNGPYADVWRFHPNGTSWEKVTDRAAFGSLSKSAAVTVRANGGETTVLAGGVTPYKYVDDVWATKDRGETWTKVATSPGWKARFLHGLASVRNPLGGDTIVLCGGAVSSRENTADCWASSDGGAQWTQTTSAGEFGKRQAHAMASSDGALVLVGGYRTSTLYLNDVWRSTDLGATWTQLTASAPFEPRALFPMIQWRTGNRIALFGGLQVTTSGTKVLGTGWVSSDAGETWERYMPSPAPWEQRYAMVAVPTLAGGVTIVSGESRHGVTPTDYNDAWHGVPV